MKKKTICLLVIVIVLLICMIAYFRPLSLSNTVSENSRIDIVLHEYGNENADMKSFDYHDISTEQKSAVLTVLEEYTYRRTLGTPFSNGYVSGVWNKQLMIYVLDNQRVSSQIWVADSGQIQINSKNYSMKNAEQFIARIMEIMQQAE